MIKILFITTLVIIIQCFASASITWETTTIEMSPQPNEPTAVARFSFKNSGKNPVTILKVTPSCECTTTQLEKMIYQPNEVGSIEAIFHIGDRMGTQEKHILVSTDDPAAKKSTSLTFRVKIPDLLSYSTRLVRWKISDQVESRSVLITTLPNHPVKSIRVAKISPAEASAVISSEDGRKFTIEITPSKLTKNETITFSFLAVFDDGTSKTFDIYGIIR